MRVIIIGAGATGLSLAWLLARTGHSVKVIESSSHAGGLLRTFDVGNGAQLEHFYHHFFTHDAEINWLLQEMGLESKIMYQDSTMGIYRDGSLHHFNGLRDLLSFRAMGLLGRFRFGLSSALLAYRKKYCREEQQSALSWFRKNAGTDATEAIWRPMLKVKFGDKADEIPLAWIAGRLRQRVLSRRSGTERLGYLHGSLQQLTDRLCHRLRSQGVEIETGKRVDEVSVGAKGPWIRSGPDNLQAADHVVLTVPSPVAADLLNEVDPQLSESHRNIEYLGAICTILALKKPFSNVYWTNVADPGFDFGGIIEQTNLVPASEYGNQHIVYLSRYLPQSDPLWKVPDEDLIERQLKQLETIGGEDLSTQLHRGWVFRSRSAAPLTDLGFRSRIPKFRSRAPGIWSASMCHLYPEERSVNNSVRVAAELAAEMGFHEASRLVARGISDAGYVGRSNAADSAAAA